MKIFLLHEIIQSGYFRHKTWIFSGYLWFHRFNNFFNDFSSDFNLKQMLGLKFLPDIMVPRAGNPFLSWEPYPWSRKINLLMNNRCGTRLESIFSNSITLITDNIICSEIISFIFCNNNQINLWSRISIRKNTRCNCITDTFFCLKIL